MIYATSFTHNSHRKSLCSCIKDTAEKKTEVSVFPGTSETLRWSGSSLEDTDQKKKNQIEIWNATSVECDDRIRYACLTLKKTKKQNGDSGS